MESRSSADQLFGEIAVRLFFCTRRDLDRALRAQLEARDRGSNPTLGDLMRGLGILTQDQVEAVMKAQEVYDAKTVETLYGRLAVKNRLIQPHDLDVALKVHDRVGGRLRMGEILVKKGFLTWDQHDSILRLQERLLRQMEQKKGPDLDSIPPPSAPGGPPPEALHRKMPSSHHGQQPSSRQSHGLSPSRGDGT